MTGSVELWLFDTLLVASLLGMAWRLLTCRDLFRAVVLFMAFGLLVALAWARLRAPDVALAEAAVGSGMTGALLLSALKSLQADDTAGNRRTSRYPEQKTASSSVDLALTRVFPAVGALLLAAIGSWALSALPSQTDGLSALVTANLDRSGVSNPVTAVLLNFRGYDTLLEIPVLVLAVLGVWSLGPAVGAESSWSPTAVLSGFVGLLVPLAVLVAGYLLWQGGHAPGGAFQAGAVLAAAIILLLFNGSLRAAALPALTIRLLLVAGLAVFAAVAIGVMLAGGHLLEYPPRWAKGLILLIEGCLTLSIMAILTALFVGGRPEPPAATDPVQPQGSHLP